MEIPVRFTVHKVKAVIVSACVRARELPSD